MEKILCQRPELSSKSFVDEKGEWREGGSGMSYPKRHPAQSGIVICIAVWLVGAIVSILMHPVDGSIGAGLVGAWLTDALMLMAGTFALIFLDMSGKISEEVSCILSIFLLSNLVCFIPLFCAIIIAL